jgi:hypothetical protein
LLALPCSYDHANIKSTAGPAESPYRHRYLAALPNSWHSPYAHTLGDTHNNTYTLYSITSPRSLYRPYLLAGYHRLIYIHYTRLRVPNASVASRIRGGIPALSAVIEPRRCYPCYITSTHDSAACHLAPVAEPAIPASSAVTSHHNTHFPHSHADTCQLISRHSCQPINTLSTQSQRVWEALSTDAHPRVSFPRPGPNVMSILKVQPITAASDLRMQVDTAVLSLRSILRCSSLHDLDGGRRV